MYFNYSLYLFWSIFVYSSKSCLIVFIMWKLGLPLFPLIFLLGATSIISTSSCLIDSRQKVFGIYPCDACLIRFPRLIVVIHIKYLPEEYLSIILPLSPILIQFFVPKHLGDHIKFIKIYSIHWMKIIHWIMSCYLVDWCLFIILSELIEC